ncbi:phosphoglycerate dehydrogenase [Moniliophthora roreri]|nr:phosphoglycerate dehydrogenase [Moniliophthora roreri]
MRERTKFTRSLFDRLPNLKFIATTGTRNRGIDVEYAQEKGISVSGTGSGGNSTVEHIWALIMAVARDIVKEHNNIRNRNPQWQTSVAVGLQNKTLGLIGLGRLGSEIAKIAKVFGMRTIGWSPHLTSERAATAGVEFIASKEELLKESDIISIHMVLSESTKGLIGPDDFKRMKPSALLINTSRGPLVNEEALIEALRSGKIASAGLDVFDQEPLPLDHPLRRQENVTLSPHNGYVSDTNYETFWGETVENIRAYLDGKPQRLL